MCVCVCVQSAGIGGAAHLVNFKGTDTMAAIVTARWASIQAAHSSVLCSVCMCIKIPLFCVMY